MKKRKPKIGIVSLTCCEGCQFAILDQGENFFNILERFELVECSLIEDKKMPVKLDWVFVEGTPLTKENRKLLKLVRKRSKKLVALGACADLGGIAEIKNYIDKKKALKYVYPKYSRIQNPNVVSIHRLVKVDYVIPGCPISGEEFIQTLKDISEDKEPSLPKYLVCRECQAQGFECLLLKGEPCLGPIIKGGCKAICLRSKIPCAGCRGLLEDAPKLNLALLIQKKFSQKDFNHILQIFGIEDEFYKSLK